MEDEAHERNDGTAAGVTIRTSKAQVIGFNIADVEYVKDSFRVSAGQPVGNPPVSCSFVSNERGFITFDVTVEAGRHKTAPIADAFIAACGGVEHIAGGGWIDTYPRELNFMFGVNVTLEVDGATAVVPLFLGQGSSWPLNNWWSGTPMLTWPKNQSWGDITPSFAGKPRLFHYMTPYEHTFQFALQ